MGRKRGEREMGRTVKCDREWRKGGRARRGGRSEGEGKEMKREGTVIEGNGGQ